MANKIYYMDEEYSGGGGSGDTSTVSQVQTDEDSELSVLLSHSSGDQSETDNVKKNTNFRYNPDENSMSVGEITCSSDTGYFGTLRAYTYLGEIADGLANTVNSVTQLTGYMDQVREKTTQMYYVPQGQDVPVPYTVINNMLIKGGDIEPYGYWATNEDYHIDASLVDHLERINDIRNDPDNDITTVEDLELGNSDIGLTSGYWFGNTGDTGVSKSLKTSMSYLYNNIGGGFNPSSSDLLTAEADGYITVDPSTGYMTISDKFKTAGDIDMDGDINQYDSGYWVKDSQDVPLSSLQGALDYLKTGADLAINSSILAADNGYLNYADNTGLSVAYGVITIDIVQPDNFTWDGTNSSLQDAITSILNRISALEGN